MPASLHRGTSSSAPIEPSTTVHARTGEETPPTENGVKTATVPTVTAKLDIEHATVQDDPRTWSKGRKTSVLIMVSAASMLTTLAANIYNPSLQEIKDDLHATSSQISLTLSIFVLIQGVAPLLWSVLSEIKGRKIVYLSSIALFTGGSIGVALAKSIGLVIGMRCIQAAGSSAVLTIGASTLADIYEPRERGTMMGIYYSAPLLGPSLGPLLGGVLTQGFSWRACFWFLVILGGLDLVAFGMFFEDTFRHERSLAYQRVLRRCERRAAQDREKASAGKDGLPTGKLKLTARDVDPIAPMLRTLRALNTVVILIASGLIYGFTYSILYTSARVLASGYYLNPMRIGLVLLSFGLGSISGSVLGGRWSDRTLARLKQKNGGKSYPEMRLQSTHMGMIFLPPCIIAFGWLVHEHAHISAPCVFLFLCGLFSVWIYSSTLAYIVDSNMGRSSSAVATNSLFRGVFAFAAAEVAVPLQDTIGDGRLYTLWGGLMTLANVLILLVWWKGGQWREKAQSKRGL